MKLFRTIRGRLFLCYTSILLVVLFTCFLLYAQYTSSLLESRASESLQQLSTNLGQNLDILIQGMDDTADRLVSSAILKDLFYETPRNSSEAFRRQQEITEMLFTITASSLKPTIHMVGMDGRMIQHGSRMDVDTLGEDAMSRLTWMEKCLEAEGRTVLIPPREHEWDENVGVVFSVCRAFNASFGSPYDAVAEVVLPYSSISSLIESVVQTSGKSLVKISAYVFDQEGNQIYPYDQEIPASFYQSVAKQTERTGTLDIPVEGENQISAFYRSPNSELTVMLCETERELLEPVISFRNRLFLLGFLTLILTTIASALLSKQLTKPIRSIQQAISKLELNTLQPGALPSHSGSPYELDKLHHAYVDMVERLEQSLDETVAARSREIEARLLALQSQMNPHFLYNAMTIISIKAENSGAEEVVEMCDTLSEMLRYISKDSPAPVTLGEEIRYLQQYLYLMSCRYPDCFTAEIRIPAEMNAISIPKLLIQPLVENSFKHGFSNPPPWKLSVSGALHGSTWEITVTDNGVGFSSEALEKLAHLPGSTDHSAIPLIQDHIGLENIYHRLRLLYKSHVAFSVKNLPGGGCSVTIGGTTREETTL